MFFEVRYKENNWLGRWGIIFKQNMFANTFPLSCKLLDFVSVCFACCVYPMYLRAILHFYLSPRKFL